jgi:hypothetical protein
VTIDARLSGTNADGRQWVGSPILDAAGYVGLIPESIDQILAVGGSFKSTSVTNFIQEPGAAINVSGGYVAYQGGMMSTTRLLGADGRIYAIGSADPAIAYVGVLGGFTVDHPRWNVTEIFNDSLLSRAHFQPGYISGASAGSIGVTALTPILDGDLVANIVAGDRQRALAGSSGLAASDVMPSGASLNIVFANPNPATSSSSGAPNRYNVVLEPQADAGADPYGLISGGFSFATASTWTPVLAKGNGPFPVFSDILSAAGFGSISIKGANQLSMPADATLSVLACPTGLSCGGIILDNVTTIDGTLNAPSGKISLTGFTYASAVPQLPPTPALVIGPDAVLNVAGL